MLLLEVLFFIRDVGQHIPAIHQRFRQLQNSPTFFARVDWMSLTLLKVSNSGTNVSTAEKRIHRGQTFQLTQTLPPNVDFSPP